MSKRLNESYSVISKIGHGSFSIVFKVQDKVTKNLYAAKFLRDTFSRPENCHEIKVMRTLKNHPNVLHLFDYFYDNNTHDLILIMELMDMNLYQFLNKLKKPLPEQKVKKYFLNILRAVEFLHSNGYFHRDIKPENILLKIISINDTKKCMIKLGDLGCAKLLNENQPYTEYMATRWYRAPECLLTSGFYGPKMDIWALGCVFYEMITTKPLFPGKNEIDQLNKIHHVIGTPNLRLLSKYRKKFKDVNFEFNKGTGFYSLLSSASEEAVKILQQTLIYDPDKRSNIHRLLKKSYFSDLK